MVWHSWSDFFAMGGYGLYVWGSVAATFGCMATELAGLRLRRRATLRALGRALS